MNLISTQNLDTHYAEFNLSSLLPNLNNDFDDYYRYMGSLTTPPCSESVVWTIFNRLTNISSRQLKIVRGLNLNYNHRQPQLLYKRKVYSSFSVNEKNEIISANTLTFIQRLKSYLNSVLKYIFKTD